MRGGGVIRSYVIGTDPTCDIVVVDQYASSRHARVFEDRSGQVWVEDLGSTNGTHIIRGGSLDYSLGDRVNGPTLINPGDTIRLGRTRLPYQSGSRA